MHSNLMMSIRALLAHPDRPDRDALFKVFADEQASNVLTCLAPPGSLTQIAAALHIGWSWCCDGWKRHTDALVSMITDPRCPNPEGMMSTWGRVSGTVGVLRNRTDDLFAWGQHRLERWMYDDLATLLGPSDAAARLLANAAYSVFIGRTLRRWSMVTDPGDPTMWQTMIKSPDLRAVLHQRADPSNAFPAWGWDASIVLDSVLFIIVDDLFDGWAPDHPSIQGQIAWIEHHVDPNLAVGPLAIFASIGRSDVLAEAVCVRVLQNHLDIRDIVHAVPWSQLHPRIQTVIDETMRQTSDQWARTWACAIGESPLVPDNDIDADLLLWRIEPERWEALDAALRSALVSRITFPRHCFGWGVHPDLVAGKSRPNGRNVRFWNPDVPPDDLRAWAYADVLRAQSTLQEARDLIALLHVLPPNRRARFEQIIDWKCGRLTEPSAESPWDWTSWAALPAADRRRRLRARLRALWGDRITPPAVQVWQNRSDPVAPVMVAFRDLLDSRRAPRILAALLAQIPALRVHMPKPGPTLPFPNDPDAARRAQIERLPLDRDAQAYAAWGLWLLASAGDVGADLLALHPDVAVALAPVLTTEQRAMVTNSPAAQGWESITHLRWGAACVDERETHPRTIQRRIS